jgi:diguanylate cyclase (GGDEF)-like protein
VSRLLAELDSPTGRTVSTHVHDVLEAYEHELIATRDSGLVLARELIAAWLNHVGADDPLATQLRMLALRLEAAPAASETTGLLQRIRELAPDTGKAETSFSPASSSQESTEIMPSVSPAEQTSLEDSASVDSAKQGDASYRRHLAEKRERIQKIQAALMQQMNEVIRQNEKFGVLLEIEEASLRDADTMDELRDLKTVLVGEVDRMRGSHQALTQKLDVAAKYLQIIGTEGKHLNDELTRAHILSLTDELTDLPNRRAFLRRLEDEVARVQRYGYPLSLALIDMDSFKSINDRYGHGAGDEVLRSFAANMLSVFRHHDMVARYGGEEFAVLLPNTDRNGALRALEKVKKRTSESSYRFDGKTMAMPTFSAGISLYKPGETPGSLIERADKALYQAKRLGRNRIEIAQLDGGMEASSAR